MAASPVCSSLRREGTPGGGCAATVCLIELDYGDVCPPSLSLGFMDSCLYAARLGLFLCFPAYMKCFAPKEKLYSINIYPEKWFAVLPPWSAWPRMKAWYMRLLAEDRKWNPLLNIFPAFMRQR